jgi:HK97 family phage portal protein
MGLFDFWRTKASINPSDPHTWPEEWVRTWLPESGAQVTPETAMRMTAVYGCVRLLSESVAGLPLQTYSKVGNIRRQHPAEDWLKRPNREYTRFRLWQEMMVCRLLDGNGLAEIKRLGKKILAVWPLWSPGVNIDRDEAGYLRYEVAPDRFLTDYDVIHIRGMGFPGQARALSPIGDYCAKKAVGWGLGAESYASSLYTNDATPGGYIKAPSVKTKEEADRLKEQWLKSRGGRYREPAVFGGDTEWKSVSFEPEATQLIQSRGFQVEEICRIYGVPPHMVASVERSTSWGTGIEQQGIQWVTYSLRPWLERIEQAINPLLARPSGLPADADVFCKFNVEGLLRGDFKSRMEGYEVGIRTGMYTPNRCLALEDEEPYEGGDKHYMDLNKYAIEDGPPARTAADKTVTEPPTRRVFLCPHSSQRCRWKSAARSNA